MNRTGDAGSCAALAADLRAGSRMLRAALEQHPDASNGTEASDLAATLDDLAEALTRFAHELRDPRPPLSGRPHPHTALRSAALRIVAADQTPR